MLTTDYLFRWSDHGRYLAATSYHGGLVVWEIATGEASAVLHGQLVAPIFSPDEQLLAVTDLAQNQLHLYAPATGQLQHTLAGATAQQSGIAFAPDGRRIAYGAGNTVVVAEVETGVETAVLTGYPPDQTIVQASWSPDGRAILTASGMTTGNEAPGVVALWQQTADGSWAEQFRVENVRAAYDGHAAALFNPTGNLVAFESLPRHEAGQFQVFVYDRQQQEVILTLEEYRLAAWQSDDLLLTSEAQYWVYLTQWHVHTGEKLVGLATENGNIYQPGGSFFARSSYGGRNVEIWDWLYNYRVAHGQIVRDIRQIGWSADGRFLAASTSDGIITVWAVNRSQ
jgi:WD40 repeat protein